MAPLHYREAPRKTTDTWPPRFMKFILHLRSPDADATQSETIQIAFMDARRLGRIRMCQSPLAEPPISNMGFDPILSMPSLDDFQKGLVKRTCPIKALLLDQTFSAGVGNWVAGTCASIVRGSWWLIFMKLQMRYCTMHVFILSNDAIR